jgi:ADP-ribosylglycohydrolase
MYIGGDTDTLATIACESSPYNAPKYLEEIVKKSLVFRTDETYSMILENLRLEDIFKAY